MDPISTFTSPYALLAILAIAVATRGLNAFLTDVTAPDWVTSSVTVVLAGLGAVSAYLVDVKGVGTATGALAAFVAAVVAAKGVTAAHFGIEPRLKEVGGHIGAGQSGVNTYR